MIFNAWEMSQAQVPVIRILLDRICSTIVFMIFFLLNYLSPDKCYFLSDISSVLSRTYFNRIVF